MSPDAGEAELHARLAEYQARSALRSKGRLSLALTITRRAFSGMPINLDELVTAGGGQVAGTGMAATQRILAEYGITKVLSREGGRTSRRSLLHAREYAAFLNELHALGLADLPVIERWWIARIAEFFAASPLRIDRSNPTSMRAVIASVLDQARQREIEAGQGQTIVGTVLQFLVAAKLSLLDSHGTLIHHGANVADEQSGRSGDYRIGRSVVHITTSPTEALAAKCRDNLSAGLRPVIVTLDRQVPIAEELARRLEIEAKVDIHGATAFLGANLLEASNFHDDSGQSALLKFVEAYNKLVAQYETDPSLRIDAGSSD